MFPDEAANGLDVNSILDGDVQPFYERGNGREALFFYFLAAVVAAFGRGPWQHHIVSAGFGLAAVIATYFLTKRMFGKNTALLAAFFMAVSSYAVTVTRTAFRANLVPFFATMAILFTVRFFQDKKHKYLNAILAGGFFGLGFYTYTSFRMMLALAIGFKILLLLASRDKVRQIFAKFWRYKLAAAGAFALTMLPLAGYFLTHPGSLVGRAGQVSIFSPALNHGDVAGTFLGVFRQTIVSFFAYGDLNWRHNVSGYAFLSPLISPFFAVALIVFTVAGFQLLKQAWHRQIKEQTFYMALVAAWFWLMLVPEITTAEGIPHGLRLIGVMPAIFILPAWAVNRLWQKIKSYNYRDARAVIAIIFLSAVFLYNFYLYFGVAAGSPEYYYAFRSDLTAVSEYLNSRNKKETTYLSLDKFSVQTVDYLTTATNNPYLLVDPAHTYEVKLKKGDQVVFTMSTLYDQTKFSQTHRRAQLVREERNQFGQIIMLVYEQP